MKVIRQNRLLPRIQVGAIIIFSVGSCNQYLFTYFFMFMKYLSCYELVEIGLLKGLWT